MDIEEKEHQDNMNELEKQGSSIQTFPDKTLKIAEILGYKSTEVDEYKHELDRIWEWAKEGRNEEDALWEIRYRATRMGNPLGVNKIKQLFTYVSLLGNKQKAENALKKWEVTNGKNVE